MNYSCLGLLRLSPFNFHNKGVPEVLPYFPLFVPWSRNSLKEVSWGGSRAHLTCFSFLKDHHSLLPVVSCLENSYFISSGLFNFILFTVSDGKLNLVTIISSWLQAKVVRYTF